MSVPTIAETLSGYTFAWDDLNISIVASRVVVHNSDSRVTGELLIQSEDGNGKTINIFPQTSFNFSAARTRQEIVKGLLVKYAAYPWAEMIDQLCFGVQDRARQGEPVLELWTNKDAIKPEWLLEPILFKGLPTVIFGEKGVAKSTMALVFYFCLLLPWNDNPLELSGPAESVTPLLLDWETEPDIVHYYAKQIQEGHNLGPIPINYRRCTLPLADDLDQIQKAIERSKATVVIIDSLGQAAGGELAKPEQALRFFGALRKLKVSSLIIAQTSKDTESKQKSIFGSTFFTYYARNILELCRSDKSGEDNLDIALFHRWCNVNRLHKELAFRIHYNEAGVTINRRPFDKQEFMEKLRTRDKVLGYLLKAGKGTATDIAKMTKVPLNTVSQTLKRLAEQGTVVKIGEEWAVLQKEATT